MERELGWFDLEKIVSDHETCHNYTVLQSLCARYYPTATRVVVSIIQEYDDNIYYPAFDAGNLQAFEGEKELSLPSDDVELLLLLSASPGLKADLAEEKPDEPTEWLQGQFYDEANDLGLCGLAQGYDLEVDLTTPPREPKKVYVKEGERDAVPADE